MKQIVGCDLALNHGSLVTFEGRLLHYFEDGVGMMSTADTLYERAQKLALDTPMGSVVVIDWDRDQGSWSQAPKVGLLITMAVSFYGALAQATRGCEVHYVTPSLVRFCLGLKDSVSKETVHEYVCRTFNRQPFMNDRYGDMMDAWVLAVTYECARSQFSL